MPWNEKGLDLHKCALREAEVFWLQQELGANYAVAVEEKEEREEEDEALEGQGRWYLLEGEIPKLFHEHLMFESF